MTTAHLAAAKEKMWFGWRTVGESGNMGTPHRSLINPELATIRVRINSRFKNPQSS